MTNQNPPPPRKRGRKATTSSVPPSSNGIPNPPANLPPPVTPTPAQVPPAIPASSPDPGAVRNTSDPGDATQRNFRYQHAYGVMLMAACRRGERQYVAIWCEHHEDLLGQRPDGRYDGFQIKTSRPENGPWWMLDADMVKTIGRFVDLVKEFGQKVGELYFVTNTEFGHVDDNHQDDKKRARRPLAFLAHVRACNQYGEISALYQATFKAICGQCGCQPEDLFDVFKRMNLVTGPSRDSFLAVLAHEHLGKIEGCTLLSPAELDAWRDELIARVYAASSLAVTDPIRHLRPLIDATDIDPALQGKRLVVAEMMAYSVGKAQAPFSFTGPPLLELGTAPDPHILQAKLEQGKAGDQVEYLRARERAAEAHLMAEALRDSKGFPAMLRQLEEVVLGECCEAHLRAKVDGEPYGERMLISIQERLKKLATDEPKRVFHRTYDCLMGLVGLLTTDTRVWFSPRFPIQESAA